MAPPTVPQYHNASIGTGHHLGPSLALSLSPLADAPGPLSLGHQSAQPPPAQHQASQVCSVQHQPDTVQAIRHDLGLHLDQASVPTQVYSSPEVTQKKGVQRVPMPQRKRPCIPCNTCDLLGTGMPTNRPARAPTLGQWKSIRQNGCMHASRLVGSRAAHSASSAVGDPISWDWNGDWGLDKGLEWDSPSRLCSKLHIQLHLFHHAGLWPTNQVFRRERREEERLMTS